VTAEPLVSVVTPVHNGAAYIEECIASVLGQTYTNWEHTLVDNASTDQTPELIAKLGRKDSRIRHLRFEEFVSSTDNHNRAFRSIDPASEFCKVVQSDDWLYPECLTRMVEAAQVSESIAIVSSYRLWETTVDLVGLPYRQTFAPGRDVLRQSLLGGPYLTGAPTALLLRSSCLREQEDFYEPGYWHPDTEAAYRLLSRHDFGFVHQVLTFARRQQGARMQWTDRVNTYTPENIRFLLRYGTEVLTHDEWRRQLREEFRKYLVYHIRQFPRFSRLGDTEFFAVHHNETEAILEESGKDNETRAWVYAIRALLLRGQLGRRSRTDTEIEEGFRTGGSEKPPSAAAGEG
jgi:glycosyltransferase involved in cell wall biosynthesis